MNKRKYDTKTRKSSSKMVIEAFSPVGAPRTPECERYSLSCFGIDEGLSDRGGESNAG